ncbi:hypothetical protein JOF56_007757 [Kibdelosporangium banguiense]|uniref:Alpha/beta hydrolase n=1 Tax=Kibdelosporangium banguiense TaxID=1365924 RepID=A0ABS4TSK2_9PSEU|nr:hypothetical protein [Kibdelosporangium banguiense]MBP2327372.1 hypothetical protein [Kibdelosporangium banguiense]
MRLRTAAEYQPGGGSSISFGELAEGALEQITGPVPSPDLLIVAHGLGDSYPSQSVSARLDHLLGGGARNFAVSEQGIRAPFKALRIARGYTSSGRCEELALVVVEQTSGGPPKPASSVFLLFGGTGGLQLTSLATTAPGRPVDLAGLPDRALLVAGHGIDPAVLADCGLDVHEAAPGSQSSSVWRELATHYEAWARAYDAVVLCDTDTDTGHSEIAVFRSRMPSRQQW